MSVAIDPARSNGPLNVLIAGSAPGKTGVGIADVSTNSAGNLVFSKTDGTQSVVDAQPISDAASKQALNTLSSGGFAGVDLGSAHVGTYTMQDVASAALGKSGLPVDVVNNGGIIMAGPTPLPAGYVNNGGVVMRENGS